MLRVSANIRLYIKFAKAVSTALRRVEVTKEKRSEEKEEEKVKGKIHEIRINVGVKFRTSELST